VSRDTQLLALGTTQPLSSIVTVEPRRRRFHEPVTVTIPVPKRDAVPLSKANKKSEEALKLFYSITGEIRKLKLEHFVIV